MDNLFIDSKGNSYGRNDVLKVLKSIGADDCDMLFIHSDIKFGAPLAGFSRKEYLQTLWEVLCELKVKNIVVPTFTYSFCNNEDYDVRSSKTTMGALNEFIRKLDGRYRTLDPLLSLSVPLSLREKFENLSEHSLGKESGLDRIHLTDGVKFLFFGANMSECFTYLHYVEKMMDVPYRFDMPFEGNVTDESGNTSRKKQVIHTQCYGIKLPEHGHYFEDYLLEKRFLIKARLGDNYVSCLSEKDAYREIVEKLHNDIGYFLGTPFTKEDLVHKYTYDPTRERITHC